MANGSRAKNTKPAKDEEEDDEEEAPSHGKKDIKGALEALDSDGWEDTEEKSFSEVPEGKYQVKIEKAELNHSKNSGRFQCSWTFVIVSGPQKNRKIFKHDGLDNEDGRSFFRGTLAKLGCEWPKKASELPEVLEELLDTYAEVTVKKKDEYTNCYINKAIDSDALESSDDEEDEDEDEVETKDKKGKAKDKPKQSGDDDDSAEEDDEDENEDEAESEDGDEEEEETAEEDEAEEGVVTDFDDENILKDQKKAIEALAKKHGFDPANYNTKTDLLADVAENLGIKGKFKNAKELIAAVEKVKPKGKK